MLAEVCPELAAVASRASCSRRQFPKLRLVVALERSRAGRRASRGRKCSSAADVGASRALDADRGRTLEPARADQHPIHLRHDRLSQGGHAQPSQPAAQRATTSASCQRFTSDDRHLHSGAVLSLLRLRAGDAGCRRARRGDGRSGRIVSTPTATLDAIEQRAGHRRSTACRRCSSPSCRTRRFAERDLTSLRTGHHVRQPLPDRSHAAR